MSNFLSGTQQQFSIEKYGDSLERAMQDQLHKQHLVLDGEMGKKEIQDFLAFIFLVTKVVGE